MKYFLFPALVLAFSNAAHAAHLQRQAGSTWECWPHHGGTETCTHWQHHVTLKDGSTWEYWPHHDGTETCFDTKKHYVYEDSVPLTDRSLKYYRKHKGLFYILD